MRKRDLKVQKYMSEIVGDASFWVYFSKISWRSTTIPLYGSGRTQLYLPHHCLAAWKCKITKSPAFETKHYGHPALLLYKNIDKILPNKLHEPMYYKNRCYMCVQWARVLYECRTNPLPDKNPLAVFTTPDKNPLAVLPPRTKTRSLFFDIYVCPKRCNYYESTLIL